MPPNPPKRIQRPQREGYAGAVRTARGSAAAFCPIAHRVKPLETLLPSVPPLPGGGDGALYGISPSAALEVPSSHSPRLFLLRSVSLGVFSFSLLPSHLSFWKPFNSFRHFLKHLRAAALGAWRWRWEWGREGALGAKHLSAVSPSVFLSPLLAKRVWRAAAFLCEQRRGCCPERRSDGTAAGRLPQFLIYALVNGAVPCGPQPAGCRVRREANIQPFFTLSIPSLGGMSCRPLLLPRRSVCCPCWGSAHALG